MSTEQCVPADAVVAFAEGLPTAYLAGVEAMARMLSARAPAIDRTGIMPPEIFVRLRAAGLLAASLPPAVGGDGLGLGRSGPALTAVLTAIGSGDLSVGRLYEGHVNALLLVDRFGTPAQKRRVAAAVIQQGMLLGVWNTDARRPLTLLGGMGGWRLTGGKAFASGAGLVSLALVTAGLPGGGRQMLLVPMRPDGTRIDKTVWTPLGMRGSMSFEVDFDGIAVDAGDFLGAPDDYLAEPWFSAGCIRFAAVQLGGALALLRVVHTHLRAAGRESDPYQVERFARMRGAVEGARLWLSHAADTVDRAEASKAEAVIASANMARHAVEEACRLVLDLAGRSIGVKGMLAPHPMERLIRDLSTYLCQPAPDGALASVGQQALAAGELPW